MRRSEIEKFFSDDEDFFSNGNTQLMASDDEGREVNEFEGQLSIDMYESGDNLIITAPVAEVDSDDLEIQVEEDMVSIKGKRHEDHRESKDNYFVNECYWGSFSRVQSLPVPVIAEKAEASINKKGILTIRVPKASRSKNKLLKIKSE